MLVVAEQIGATNNDVWPLISFFQHTSSRLETTSMASRSTMTRPPSSSRSCWSSLVIDVGGDSSSSEGGSEATEAVMFFSTKGVGIEAAEFMEQDRFNLV